MTIILIIALVAAMAATAYVLVRGVMAMASGKVGNQEQQQQWMRKRVLYQGIAKWMRPTASSALR
jgi:FlaG/FlaF family flagellin (archaellin)